jgi:hypothetical protein
MTSGPVAQAVLRRRAERFARALGAIKGPVTINALSIFCSRFGLQCHLAIVSEPYLTRIATGEKSIESRFSKVTAVPYRGVFPHDVLLLKETSEPLRAIAVVSFVSTHGPLSPGQARELMRRHQERLCLDGDFVASKRNSRYATLMHLDSVFLVPAVKISKRDRRPWVVLNASAQRALFRSVSPRCRATEGQNSDIEHGTR